MNGKLVEDTFDWHAQDKEGNVWYFGENSREIENGKVVSTEGSWEAGVDGVGVLKELRAAEDKVPVTMLTARGDPLDKVHNLDRGADDYLTKPFNVEELMARLRALLGRFGSSRPCEERGTP